MSAFILVSIARSLLIWIDNKNIWIPNIIWFFSHFQLVKTINIAMLCFHFRVCNCFYFNKIIMPTQQYLLFLLCCFLFKLRSFSYSIFQPGSEGNTVWLKWPVTKHRCLINYLRNQFSKCSVGWNLFSQTIWEIFCNGSSIKTSSFQTSDNIQT